MVLKLALVGYGYWGPNLARNFSKVKDSQLLYIVDMDEKKRRKAMDDYPQIETYEKLEDVLDKVDAVIVATPPKTHFAVVKQALNAGKHVLVEKPVTTSLAEAKELKEIATKKKLVLMVDYTFIYVDYVRYIKQLMDKGELGSIGALYFQRQGIEFLRRDVNVVEDLLPHDISMLVYWMGEKAAKPRKITAGGKSHYIKGVEDEAVAYLDYGDFTATMLVSSLSPVKIRNVMVVGDRKMAEYDDVKVSGKVEVHDKEIKTPLEAPSNYWEFMVQYNKGSITVPYINAREPLSNMASHFVDCASHNKKPDTDISFGLIVTELMEKINEAVKASAK